MTAELLRLRLLVAGAAFATVAVTGLPDFRPVAGGPATLAAGLGVAVVLFVVLAGAPRLPAEWHRVPLVAGYLAAGAAVEELLWRGLGLAALSSLVGAVAALMLTSIGFALAHAPALGRRCSVHLAHRSRLRCGVRAGRVACGRRSRTPGYNVLVDLGVRAGREREGAR